MYTIKKGNLYIRDNAKFGGKSSYTSDVKYAVKYETLEDAKKNACGNESVVKLTLVWGER